MAHFRRHGFGRLIAPKESVDDYAGLTRTPRLPSTSLQTRPNTSASSPTSRKAEKLGFMNFYDEVLRELVLALGAALFFGNLLALARRRNPKPAENAPKGDLPKAPVGRSVLYAGIGFFVMIWGIASIAAK